MTFNSQFQDKASNLPAERIVVFERKTGKVLTGPMAPTPATLKPWLQRHPTFEVLVSGTKSSQSQATGTVYSSKLYCLPDKTK